MNIIYEKVNDYTVNDLLKGVVNNFATNELLTSTLKVDQSELIYLFSPIIKNSFSHSYVAKDFNTDKIIGGIICNDFYFFINEHILEDKIFTDEMQGILFLLNELEKKYINNLNSVIDKNTHLYQFATYVEPEYYGKGVATELYKISENEAKNYGYKKLITISTGPVSQHIRINKLNFNISHEIDYQSFYFKGKNIFSNIHTVKSCMLLIKEL